ncbi:DivIVA domain-containing protein [uncultured Jatrophihabitans sp.]|uniref:DivIVA domain-containing protein n=1 Tax=uncultured Jatrophihabitans sp. TaxID=1610747 RepID=UPI0035CC6681
MFHLVLYILLAIIVAVGLFLVASRFLPAGEQIAPAIRDEPVWELPAERDLRAEDVDGVRLPVALRGYRFAETDILLDRLAGELRARDAEIARLRGEHQPELEPTSEPAVPVAAVEPEPTNTSADDQPTDDHA